MKHYRSRISCLATFLVVLVGQISVAGAEVRLPNIFGDKMVLQRDKPVTIWGFAAPQEKVAVTFAGQSKSTVADGSGDWMIKLNAMPTSFDGRKLKVTGEENAIEIDDVLVGEVWICGGQSNMEWTLRGSTDGDVEIASADWPAIRFIRLPKIASIEPKNDFPVESETSSTGNWRTCTADQVENCTGVGYYFAKRIHRVLRTPVGLIDTSWGGTMAQHWVSKETLRAIPEMKSYFDTFESAHKAWIDGGGEAGAKRRYEADLKKWEEDAAAARAEGKRPPGRPNFRNYSNPADKHQPGGMYNGVLMPITKSTVRGAIFYQGENNSFGESWKPFPNTYPAVISDWRKALGEPDLPFGLIQIAGWSTRRTMTYDMNHHCNIVREVQFLTWQRTPGTGLVVTFDTNTSESIHPSRKLPVGERAARWALAEVYDWTSPLTRRRVEWKGPVYDSYEVTDGKIHISFKKDGGSRLILSRFDDSGFYIAGKDREFHIAQARVHGDKIEVWSDEVAEPVAVRYAVSNIPAGHLVNGRELPAYPFRTDTWPITPHQSSGDYEVTKYTNLYPAGGD